MEEKYISSDTAAQMLGVTRRSVNRQIKGGRLLATATPTLKGGADGMANEIRLKDVLERLNVEKPIELMRNVCKICVPGGRILDPFAGSGSTLEAAELEGFDSVGVEISPEIARTASERLGTPLRHIQEVQYEEV